MCRWLAYFGDPIPIDELLYKTQHSLIDQSLHSTMGATTTNGDGFGLGWYGARETPGVYRSVHPAWNDRNLRELAGHLTSPLFFAHVRATTGTAVQETNCHPFRHGRWLFMHNGLVREFHRVRRELMLTLTPEHFDAIEGTTDSEVLFRLALTLGLDDEPIAALERMVGLVEETCGRHGIEQPLQMALGLSDGESVIAVRYSSERNSRSLFYSESGEALKQLYPENERLQMLSDEARVVVSEPLGDLPGVWHEVPESSVGVVRRGQDELLPFVPRVP